MKIHLLAIGQRMPNWVEEAFNEYAKRLPSDYSLLLKPLTAEKRNKSSDTQRLLDKESTALFEQCPKNTTIIAFDRKGKDISTEALASSLQTWHDQSQDISLLIGGPEGISDSFLKKANSVWSLSKLTLPHPLVRVIVAEQIYRAWSIISSHPYHR